MAGTANTATGGAPATQIVANPTTGSLPTGDAGIDTLWDRPFIDTMTGGLGNDIFRGQAGDDVITGGLGDDQYVVFTPGPYVVGANVEGGGSMTSPLD